MSSGRVKMLSTFKNIDEWSDLFNMKSYADFISKFMSGIARKLSDEEYYAIRRYIFAYIIVGRVETCLRYFYRDVDSKYDTLLKRFIKYINLIYRRGYRSFKIDLDSLRKEFVSSENYTNFIRFLSMLFSANIRMQEMLEFYEYYKDEFYIKPSEYRSIIRKEIVMRRVDDVLSDIKETDRDLMHKFYGENIEEGVYYILYWNKMRIYGREYTVLILARESNKEYLEEPFAIVGRHYLANWCITRLPPTFKPDVLEKCVKIAIKVSKKGKMKVKRLG